MLKTVRQLLAVLSPSRRRMFFVLIALYMVVGLLQAMGVAAIGPFTAVALDPVTSLSGGGLLASLYAFSGVSSPRNFLVLLGVAAAGLIVLGQTSFLLVERVRVKWMYITQAELTRNVFRNVLLRPYDFFATRHSSSLHTVVLSEVQQASSRFLFPLIETVSRVTVILCILLTMLLVDWTVTLVAAVFMGGLVTGIYLVTARRMKRSGVAMRATNEMRFNRAFEILSGHKEIKLRGTEASATRRFQEIVFHYANLASHAELLRTLPRPLIEMTVFAGAIFAATALVFFGNHELTTFMPKAAVFLLAGYRIMPAAQLALQTLQGMRVGEPMVHNVLKELATPVKHEPTLAEVTPDVRRTVNDFHTLALSGVVYAYPGAKTPALKGVDFKIARNASIGIVGKSGAGKSTLMDVMLGLLRPTAGTLTVDGTVLEGPALAAWRAEVGYVAQSIFIADDTVAANVAFGHPEPDMERVARAVRLAALQPYVEAQPEGLLARVGEAGVRMSGGQRQRLAVARALYNDPNVVFFDEATSALDTATESAIMKELSALVGTRTLIVIAHRLSTLTICDTIVEMADGRITRVASNAEFFGNNLRP